MGSNDYMNSARRAGLAFSLFALVALGAAGFKVAASFWDTGAMAAAPPPVEKHSVEPPRRVRVACWPKSAPECASVQLALAGGLAR
jgi:hypothetical protein